MRWLKSGNDYIKKTKSNMKLTIKNTGRLRLQGLVRGRYNMIEIIESKMYYNFTFSDKQSGRIIEAKLQREGIWSREDKNWQYYFLRGNQCVTADWFRNINNVRWALNEYLKHT